MKKRFLAGLMGLVMVFGMVACGNTDDKEESSADVVEYVESAEESAEATGENEVAENTETAGSSEEAETVVMTDTVTVLETIWDTYAEDEKFYVVGGLDMTSDGPAAVDLTDTEMLDIMCHIPEEQAGYLTEAAMFSNAMNGVEFTAVCAMAGDEKDVDSAIAAIREAVINYEGYFPKAPDALEIVHSGKFIIYFFGNEDSVATFDKHMLEVYANVTVDCSEKIVVENDDSEGTASTGGGLKTNSKGEIIDDGF